MDATLEKLEILKRLCLQYQQTHDKVIFERIIERVDNLIIYVTLSFYYKYRFVEKPDLQDLYQIGILGLYKAVETMREQDDACLVPARIIFYIKSEIIQSYSFERKEKEVVRSFCVKERCTSDEENFREMESEDIQKIFSNLISNGIISQKDYNLLIVRFVEEMPIDEIVRTGKYGKHWRTVNRKIQRILGKIRNVINQDLKEDLS